MNLNILAVIIYFIWRRYLREIPRKNFSLGNWDDKNGYECTQVPVEPHKVDQNHKVDPTQVMLMHYPPEQCSVSIS